MTNMIITTAALLLGSAVGFGFGALQNAALLRNKKREESGKLRNGWTLIPGAGGRVAVFLLVLVTIQILCPLLFEGPIAQWLVSAGVLLGYGWTLVSKLRNFSAHGV